MSTSGGLGALRRLRDGRAGAEERCELCGEPFGRGHGHLLELPGRQLRCCCRACRLLFEHPGAGAGRLRTIPPGVRPFADAVAGSWWTRLGVPVGVAFVVVADDGQPSAGFPGAAGTAWAELDRVTWAAFGEAHPEAAGLLAEVQAVLIHLPSSSNRRSGGLGVGDRGQGWIVPVDTCFELVGALRQAWRGFDGGPEAGAVLDRFLGRLATPAPARSPR